MFINLENIFLDTGNFFTKLDLHRSMITGICVNSNDDIFASCSTDGLVNISSLSDFCILNQIVISRPILHMDISLNSTFLMLSTDDNSVLICALSTGTQIHCIEVSSIQKREQKKNRFFFNAFDGDFFDFHSNLKKKNLKFKTLKILHFCMHFFRTDKFTI